MPHPGSILVVDNERCRAARAWAKLHERNEIDMPQEHESLPSSHDAAPGSRVLPVLIVDDDSEILDMLRNVLEEAGFVVLTAGDGKAALALLQHTSVALVLTDLMMPQLTGLQLAQQMRSNPQTAAIPVLVMSAALPPHLPDVFVAVIAKPFELDDLVTSVRQFGPKREGDVSGSA
jgi:CheY-like chemotaxis protein